MTKFGGLRSDDRVFHSNGPAVGDKELLTCRIYLLFGSKKLALLSPKSNMLFV